MRSPRAATPWFGGVARGFGYCRFGLGPRATDALTDVSGGPELKIASAPGVTFSTVRLYARALRTSEAVGNFRALDRNR